jgi:hypothetical protein
VIGGMQKGTGVDAASSYFPAQKQPV